MMGAEKNQFIIRTLESRFLLTTSCLNVFPIYMAYQRSLWLYAFTSTGTMVFSLIYWYNPIHGWRRNMDLIYAKYTFVVYLGSGIWYIPHGIPNLLFYLGALSIFQMYVMTYVYPKIWIRFHVLFHVLSICVKVYILYYVTGNQCRKLKQ